MVTVNDDLDFATAAALAERLGYTVVRPEILWPHWSPTRKTRPRNFSPCRRW